VLFSFSEKESERNKKGWDKMARKSQLIRCSGNEKRRIVVHDAEKAKLN